MEHYTQTKPVWVDLQESQSDWYGDVHEARTLAELRSAGEQLAAGALIALPP